MRQLATLDGIAQAQLVRERKISKREMIEAASGRIDELNDDINAVVTGMYEEALTHCDGPEGGALAGVPILVKDWLATCEGVRHTEGSAFLADYVAPADSELVARLRRGGLIIVGKSNTPEFGIAGTTEPALFGPTLNPWSRERIVGGSSGGAAAAVAAGLVPIAHGSDAGGSIRIPASCCGVFGLKPSRGRTPIPPQWGDIYARILVEHALTRSVRDSAAFLDVTVGADAGDPYKCPLPRELFAGSLSRSPRLRIAFARVAPSGVAVHPDCEAAVDDAARLCEELGHHVEEASPKFEATALGEAFLVIWTEAIAWMADQWAALTRQYLEPSRFESRTWAMLELGRTYSAMDHLRALRVLQEVERSAVSFFATHDAWLTPSLAQPPLKIGDLRPDPAAPLVVLEREAAFTPFMEFANVAGLPAASLPLFWNSEDLPIGVQLVGRFRQERTLLRLCAELEAARPWATRRPPLFAGVGA